MKVVKNEKDGTVTVTIPRTDEVYEPADGGLYTAETLSKEDFEAALHPPKKAKAAAVAEG
jgi:hypothetical protein